MALPATKNASSFHSAGLGYSDGSGGPPHIHGTRVICPDGTTISAAVEFAIKAAREQEAAYMQEHKVHTVISSVDLAYQTPAKEVELVVYSQQDPRDVKRQIFKALNN